MPQKKKILKIRSTLVGKITKTFHNFILKIICVWKKNIYKIRTHDSLRQEMVGASYKLT